MTRTSSEPAPWFALLNHMRRRSALAKGQAALRNPIILAVPLSARDNYSTGPYAHALSDALKNIRGDFLFWQREVYEHLNKAPEKGKSKSKPFKVWQTQWEKPKKGGKGSWPSGPTRSKPKGKGGKGKSPNTPSVPWPDHWAFKNPKGEAYCRDHHLRNKCSGSCGGQEGWVGVRCPPIEACATAMPSPSQVTGGHSGCHRPRGFLVSVGTTGHQCESAHRGGEPTPRAEGRQSGGGQDGLQGATGPGSPTPDLAGHLATQEGAERGGAGVAGTSSTNGQGKLPSADHFKASGSALQSLCSPSGASSPCPGMPPRIPTALPRPPR